MWNSLQKKYRNSVFFLNVVSAEYDSFRPYTSLGDKSSTGSGFLISLDIGLVVTNAHVVENAISIVGRCPLLYSRDLFLRLISISRDKDLALLQIIGEDLKELKKFSKKINEFSLGDSFDLFEMQEVVAIGYPLGQDGIKFTHGNVSGFQYQIDEVTDITRLEDSSTFIQITCPINQGNSGGPLIDEKGKVVGICAAGILDSQNVGYAIPVNTLLSILDELKRPISNFNHSLTSTELKNIGLDVLIPVGGEEVCLRSGECFKTPYIFTQPRFGIEWCATNKDLISHIFGERVANLEEEYSSGVYITFIYPDSIFGCEGLKVGDLLYKISVTAASSKFPKLIGKIDSHGVSDLEIGERKLVIKDFIDYCSYGGDITIYVMRRNGKKNDLLEVSSVFLSRQLLPNEKCLSLEYPHFCEMEYEILGGLCITYLDLEKCSSSPQLRKYSTPENRFKRFLVVAQVFSGTEASSVGSLSEGDVIVKVGDVEIKTLEDLRNEVEKCKKYVALTSEFGKILITNKKRMEKDTQLVKDAYGIK